MDTGPKSPAQRYLQNSRYYPKKTDNSNRKSNDFATDIKSHHKTTGSIGYLNVISKYRLLIFGAVKFLTYGILFLFVEYSRKRAGVDLDDFGDDSGNYVPSFSSNKTNNSKNSYAGWKSSYNSNSSQFISSLQNNTVKAAQKVNPIARTDWSTK